jgi:hypothetical protein
MATMKFTKKTVHIFPLTAKILGITAIASRPSAKQRRHTASRMAAITVAQNVTRADQLMAKADACMGDRPLLFL